MSDNHDRYGPSLQYIQQMLDRQAAIRKTRPTFHATIVKKNIWLVLGKGYSAAQVDRRRDPTSGYYEVQFPRPVDEDAASLEWRLDDLLNYQEWKCGHRAA